MSRQLPHRRQIRLRPALAIQTRDLALSRVDDVRVGVPSGRDAAPGGEHRLEVDGRVLVRVPAPAAVLEVEVGGHAAVCVRRGAVVLKCEAERRDDDDHRRHDALCDSACALVGKYCNEWQEDENERSGQKQRLKQVGGGRTYSELRNGVVYDIERIAVCEVEHDLNEDCRAVNHGRLDDEHEDLQIAEGAPCKHVLVDVVGDEPTARSSALGLHA